jgi:hypothetical protein
MVIIPEEFESGLSSYPILAELTKQNFVDYLGTVTDDDLMLKQLLNRFLRSRSIPFKIVTCIHTGNSSLDHDETADSFGLPYWLGVLMSGVSLDEALPVQSLLAEIADLPR